MQTKSFFLCLILCSSLTSCFFDDSKAHVESSKSISNVEKMMESQPTPLIEHSMDRFLLSERLIRFNQPLKTTFLYVTLIDGTWLKIEILGKLTSTSKRLNMRSRPQTEQHYFFFHEYMEENPDEMGVYGDSEGSKVGITSDGSLIEIGGYLSVIYSEKPLVFHNLTKPMIELSVQLTEQEKQELLDRFRKGVGVDTTSKK